MPTWNLKKHHRLCISLWNNMNFRHAESTRRHPPTSMLDVKALLTFAKMLTTFPTLKETHTHTHSLYYQHWAVIVLNTAWTLSYETYRSVNSSDEHIYQEILKRTGSSPCFHLMLELIWFHDFLYSKKQKTDFLDLFILNAVMKLFASLLMDSIQYVLSTQETLRGSFLLAEQHYC